MTEILVNSILEWRLEDMDVIAIERVLWISPDKLNVVVININETTNMPMLRCYSEIMDALYSGTARKLQHDPYMNLINPSDAYLNKHKHRRDEAWSVIGDIAQSEPDIYDEHLR